ncbi:hypothetical protein D9758_013474 [Tetrapyrgos nigripes]|uniref:FAD-binding PCMH-type domain-containing protein n=1 Tax=Tetrapyrgos nigripes TaxID=182062 RepID=A0A8H5CT41_9AGAR|nr:hypothetical protein D9758_013474 [Tetrapyrgos nigripes]
MSPSQDLLEEFRKECDNIPELKPLYNILRDLQGRSWSNAKLFYDLWQFVHQNDELHALYQDRVDKDLEAVGRALARHVEDGQESNGSKSTAFMEHYDKTGRISAPQVSNQLNSIPKKPSFVYQDFLKLVAAEGQDFPHVEEGDGKPMVYIPNLAFQNWGLTVKNKPSYTFIARTRVGVQNLVKWASEPSVNKRVRVAGFRHTWGDFYAADGDIIVILLPLSTTIHLPSFLIIDKNSDLQGIKVSESGGQYLARIAAGTTNDQFREWCLKNKTVALPLNVIMIEITFGGSNAPICHGAGITTSTLSDLVAEVEYVDPQGHIQTVSDPEELRAASGCFGLLGVVLSVTLRVDKMQTAVMQPQKIPVQLAIPPPPNYPVPSEIDMSRYTSQDLQNAQKAFQDAIENQYYVEWFWYPFQHEVWVNVWRRAEFTTTDKHPSKFQAALQRLESLFAKLIKWVKVWKRAEFTTTDKLELGPYPSNFQAALQWLEGLFAELINNWSVFQRLPGRIQAWIFGTISLLQMPDVPEAKDAIKTYVSEALHFRRGIQNMRCLDSEWEIPIPALKGGTTRDYAVIQRAWWDGITAFYKNIDTCPMRVTLEMRLTGSSNVLLAPQQYNNLGTISIEVLTTLNPTKGEWNAFKQQVVDMWASYTDADGKPLNIRPHWAKEWQGLKVRGKDVIDYLREDAYPKEIKQFVDTLSKITSKRGSSLAETRKRFSNPLLETLIFGA